MDTPSSSVITGQPFSVHAPLRQPLVILHIVLVAMASLGCFPIALIQGARNHRKSQFYTLAAGSICALLGLVAGGAIQLTDTPTFARTMLNVIGYILLFLVIAQAGLALYQWQKNSNLQTHMILGWTVLVLTYIYLLVAALVFTESCSQASGQCLLPLAMGSGFLTYGSLAMLHLLNILSLPRSSTPEYYEGLIITLWGFVCICTADIPILGADWRAFNLGLLWCAGGIFSVVLSLQTWMPAIRERNIVNAIIICLTGRAVIAKYTQNDPYGAQVHGVLGYMLIFASIARVGQIMFRKSPSDNLPGLLAQTSETVVSAEATGNGIDDEEEERQNIYQMTYRRLTGQAPPACRHASVFASITVVCGLLVSFLFIAAGILFMGANVQWVGHVRYYIADPATYINVTMAVSFLWATYVFALCNIFKSLRPFSQSYYEYLGMSEMEAANSIPASPEALGQYDPVLSSSSSSPPLRQQYRSSLPLRRGVEEPPAMRPSQYRAKRRSLLVQSPQQQHQQHHFDNAAKKQRTRSSSSFNGVGGVLPDETFIDPTLRRSWLSNGSATSAGSAASFASAAGGSSAASSTTGAPALTSSPTRRATILFSEEEELRRTESGRRKQRQEDDQGEQQEADSETIASPKYFERNSSDSHVC